MKQSKAAEEVQVQWNPVNTDTKGTGQIVRIDNGVSVLSGVSKKSHGYTFSRREDEGNGFTATKRCLIVL